MSNDAASKPPLAYADAGGEKQDPTKSPGTGEDLGPGDMSVINGANGVLGGRSGNGNPLAAKEGDRDPAITDADVKNANGHPSALAAKDDTAASPADGQKPTPDDPSATSPTNNGQQDTTSAPTTDGDKTPTTDPNPTSADGTTPKLAPGLGPDVASVAPDLQNDPQQKLMPQSATSPADGTTAAAGLTDPKLSTPNTPNTPNTTTSPDQLKPASLSPFTSPSPQDTATSSSCKSFLMRKEYSTLTDAEKAGYARALKCVRSKPSRFNTDPHFNAADDWTLLHIRMMKYVHFTAFFTVFHRGFIAIIEQDLVACGLPKGMGMPWVDWTKTSDDPSTNAFFSDNPEWGLGTNGKGDSSECPWSKGKAVIDGALRDHYFNAPFRHRLCRGFNNLDSSHPYPHFGNNCSTFINAHFVSSLGKTHDKGKFFDFSSALEISQLAKQEYGE
ncbi:hypothetical protein NDA16_003801 [Ustilago loliicola]|nr:hypothetical protein NDA16_003801 [Ustilago loliicola]